MKNIIMNSTKKGLKTITTIGTWSVIYSVLAVAWIRAERKYRSEYRQNNSYSDAA